MTHKAIGIRPHHTLKGVDGKKSHHYDPIRLRHETAAILHLEKHVAPDFQPYDLVRHHNHLSWLPHAHTAYRLSGTPDNAGFWSSNGMGICD